MQGCRCSSKGKERVVLLDALSIPLMCPIPSSWFLPPGRSITHLKYKTFLCNSFSPPFTPDVWNSGQDLEGQRSRGTIPASILAFKTHGEPATLNLTSWWMDKWFSITFWWIDPPVREWGELEGGRSFQRQGLSVTVWGWQTPMYLWDKARLFQWGQKSS